MNYGTKVHARLYVAGDRACHKPSHGVAIVHACKSPCHANVAGRKVAATSPNYLYVERGANLYLNMIDPPTPMFSTTLFNVAMEFIGRHYMYGSTVVVHCNKGESRSPSIALLFLAKGLGVINSSSYVDAAKEFKARYKRYSPGGGIVSFLTDEWGNINVPKVYQQISREGRDGDS